MAEAMGALDIIADDLTSAVDWGIQMVRSELQAHVALTRDGIASVPETVDVVSIDTDSVTVPAIEAYQQVIKTASRVVAAGFRSIYKSLALSLRGNPGAEVDAVLDESGMDLPSVAPEFALYRRTALGGWRFLSGEPITATEFAIAPQFPVREDDLVRLFNSQSRRQAAALLAP